MPSMLIKLGKGMQRKSRIYIEKFMWEEKSLQTHEAQWRMSGPYACTRVAESRWNL